MKHYFISLFLLIVYANSYSQKILYSPVEKRTFTGFETDVICKYNNTILVYTSFYYTVPNLVAKGSLTDTNNGLGDDITNRTITNEIKIFSNDMKLLKRQRLSLADNISAVHFVVFDNYFNMFYQYQKGHTIYCMVAKFDMQANLIAKPLQLDSTTVVDYNYQNQVYSFCYSENRKFYVIYKIDNTNSSSVVINHLHYDEKFNLISKSETKISVRQGKDFLHDFNVDNEGNFIFLRTSELYDDEYATKVSLITQSSGSDTALFKRLITSSDIYIDQFHLKVDNRNKRYVISSFYSSKANGNIEGFYTVIWNFVGKQDSVITKTSFDEKLRREINSNGKDAFNNFYIQEIHLKSDGGFMIEAGNYFHFPNNHLQNRWNYLQYSSIQASQNYLLDNQYNHDYYYPWRQWSFLAENAFSYNSEELLLMNFNEKGNDNWSKILNTPQTARFRYSIGCNTAKMGDAVYFFYNVTIKNKTIITVQNINNSGEINTLENLKEDKVIMGADNDYTVFPRYGKQVSEKELVFPCITGHFICFAKIELL